MRNSHRAGNALDRLAHRVDTVESASVRFDEHVTNSNSSTVSGTAGLHALDEQSRLLAIVNDAYSEAELVGCGHLSRSVRSQCCDCEQCDCGGEAFHGLVPFRFVVNGLSCHPDMREKCRNPLRVFLEIRRMPKNAGKTARKRQGFATMAESPPENESRGCGWTNGRFEMICC